MTKGREVPALPTLPSFTFESGVTVRLRKVSPFLMNEIRRGMPPPPPPKNEVDYGDGPVWEENPTDPEYQQQLKEHEAEVSMEILRTAIEFSVEFEISDEQIEEEVARLRERMHKRKRPIELSESDPRVAYILYVCGPGDEELGKLAKAIFRISQPTEEAIAEQVATF